jgi:hypothetical protein
MVLLPSPGNETQAFCLLIRLLNAPPILFKFAAVTEASTILSWKFQHVNAQPTTLAEKYDTPQLSGI